MKKSFTTDAINLKNYPLNDNDSIVVMFSKTKGLISAVAKGAKRPKSKLGARVQMFIANRLMLFEGKSLNTISEAQSINTFSKIRSSLDKLAYSMYVAEIVNNFCSKSYNNDENYEEIYDLIFKVYEKISNAQTKDEILLVMIKFLIKFMGILGWGLDFNYCAICQNELSNDNQKSTIFSWELGGFLCDNCSDKKNGYTIRIHNKIKMFLSELSNKDMDEKTKYDDVVNTLVLEKCFSFLKKYIDNLSNKRTKIFEVLEQSGALA